MDSTTEKKRLLKWTDKDRLQLVEAVIRIEQEMVNEWKKPRPQSADQPIGKWRGTWNSVWTSTEKWNAITDLLPGKLGEKYWNAKRQVYNQPKCCGMFHNLLKVYRDTVAGKANSCARLTLSQPVFQILKRREDLINSEVPGTSLSKHVDSSCRSLHHAVNHQKQASATGNSSENTDMSSLNDARGSGRVQVKWSEAARIQVIEAVMKVEKEMISEGGCSTVAPAGKGKWDRIAALLPPGLRVRMWNSRSNRVHGEHKCSRMFYNIVSAYRARLSGTRGSSIVLSKNVMDLLNRREELFNARSLNAEEKSFISGRPKRIGPRRNSRQLLHNQWAPTESLKMTRPAIEKSPQGQFTGSEREKGAYVFSQNADGSESLEGSAFVPENESNVGTADEPWKGIGQPQKSMKRHTSGPSLGVRWESESTDPVSEAEGSRSGVETRGQMRAKFRDCSSATGPPAGQSGTLRPKRQRSASMPSSTHDEHLHTVLERSLKVIDTEFPHLSSWLQSQEIRDEFKHTVECFLAKKRKIDPKRSDCVGEMMGSVNKMIDHQVRALFYKLRTRFAAELNNACEEIAQEVMEGAQVFSTSRRSTH